MGYALLMNGFFITNKSMATARFLTVKVSFSYLNNQFSYLELLFSYLSGYKVLQT